MLPGSPLSRYSLLRIVGSGGMGIVWLALYDGDFALGKHVAIKTVLPELAASAHYRKMLLDEARTLARIDHPNVVHLYDAGEADGTLYLVMEWVEGYSLRALCAHYEEHDACLPLGAALRILADTAAGLHAAHELRDDRGDPLNVVHRDVSPQNILVGAGGTVKLIDFGIAKTRDRQATATITGAMRGKPNYIAPEQALGFEIDRRADIWALGATLFRALSGDVPFATPERLVEYVHKRASLPELPPDVPEPVRDVVKRALEREPRERFQRADELEEALDAAAFATGTFMTRAALARCVARIDAPPDFTSHPPARAAETEPPRGRAPEGTQDEATRYDRGNTSPGESHVEPGESEEGAENGPKTRGD